MRNTNWTVIILIGIVAFLLLKNQQNGNAISQEEFLNIKADLATNLAQTTFKPINPEPKPDDITIPNLADCPLCKGSRYITHADGHKTPCPYHGNANEDLEELLMQLSDRVMEQDKKFDLLAAEIKTTKGKLDLIDQHHKPVTTTKLVPNACPCGCRHLVGNCNCVASCPGKRMETYTKITTTATKSATTNFSARRPVLNTLRAITPPYPVLQENRQVRQQYQAPTTYYTQGYTIECSGGSCSMRPTFRPLRALRIRGWR